MRLIQWLMGVSLLFIATALYAQTQEDLNTNFTKAVEVQGKGDVKQAIALYENIIKEGFSSSELHNNLGLAYVEKKELGEAILNFERAIRLDRNNAAANNNLQLAKASIKDPIKELQPMFLVRWWNGLCSVFPSSTWAIVFFIMLIGAVGLQIFRLFSPKRSFIQSISISSFVIAGLVLMLGLQSAAEENNSGRIIVLKDMAGLREKPDLGTPEGTILYEGSTAYIREQQESWTEVELPNGVIGWLPNSMIAKI